VLESFLGGNVIQPFLVFSRKNGCWVNPQRECCQKQHCDHVFHCVHVPRRFSPQVLIFLSFERIVSLRSLRGNVIAPQLALVFATCASDGNVSAVLSGFQQSRMTRSQRDISFGFLDFDSAKDSIALPVG
jgi:hypothetical protein